MKEKNKKILKSLGVGALACFGMFTLTGCSFSLTPEQMEKVMYVVDESDRFMKDTLDLLEKQNAKLDKEEAWDLFRMADAKLALNANNVWDNLVLTTEEDDGEVYVSRWFKTSDGTQVLSRDDDHGPEVIYSSPEENEVVYRASKIIYEDEPVEEYKVAYEDTIWGKYLIYCGLTPSIQMGILTQYGVTLNDIVSCVIDEAGDYRITFFKSFEQEIEIDTVVEEEDLITVTLTQGFSATITISAEGIIKCLEVDLGTIQSNTDAEAVTDSITNPRSIVYTLEYGVLTEEYIGESLEWAKNLEVTEN